MATIKIPVGSKSDKQAMQEWEEMLLSIRNSTPVDLSESETDKRKRIKILEADPEAWIAYYFPKYCSSKPARFQILSFKRILKAIAGFYQRRAWFRGASKSTRRMMEVLYIMFALKMRLNLLLISKSYDNAERLLEPYMGNLEANQRLINDYGVQERPGRWTKGEFTTKKGSTFRAVGAEQSPRGAKNEELRINCIIFDDVDDDEVCRNPDRVQARWDWIEQAVIPTVDISNMYYIFFDNNIIAEDSLAVRAAEYANDVETVNVIDADGNSSWPEKNSMEAINAIKAKISYESFEKEYMNNPMSQGKTFKEIVWGKCPPLKHAAFSVIYADPATSNKDRPTLKSKAQNSCKAVAIVAHINNTYYLYKCFVDNTTNDNFIDWLFASKQYVGTHTQPYTFIENNSLQDPFYEQVFLPKIFAKEKETGTHLLISPDDTKKPEKWSRVEGTLEPLVRLGQLVFNIDEKDNPHMQRMEKQFLAAKASSKTLDGPDCVQGAVSIIQKKQAVLDAGAVQVIRRPKNLKRY